LTQWDARPDIIIEVSTSEAATADPEDTDTSAFVSRPLLLDTKKRTPKSARKAKKGHARARKPVVDTESEESEESGSGDDSGDDAALDPGKYCKKCGDYSFFAKHKVCKFYHADAPTRTTGLRQQLNKASDRKLVKLGIFKRRR
jgi:hypothetical protein